MITDVVLIPGPPSKNTYCENREQLAAAGVLESLNYNGKVPIPPNRPHLQRSQSHSVSNSSPPSPSPTGHGHTNGFMPHLTQDRYGTSPHGSRSVGPAASKYYGAGSPNSFQRPSPPNFHSSSYTGDGANLPRHMHHHSYSGDHSGANGYHHYPQGSPGHQHYYSENGQHEMSSSLPSHFHMHSSQSRPLRWEPHSNGHNTNNTNPNNNGRTDSSSPKSEPMDVTMSSSLPSLPSHGSHQPQPSLSFAHHSNGDRFSSSLHQSSHHRQQLSQDYNRAPLSSSSPSNGHHGYEPTHNRGYSEGPSHHPQHQHSHSGSFSNSSRGSPGPFTQSYSSFSNLDHRQQQPSSSSQHSPQSGHHRFSSSPSSSSYYQNLPSPQGSHGGYHSQQSSYHSNGNGHHISPSVDDRRFHSAPIPVRHR
ncbi:hypothetical protein BX616_004250 [Lobosporangium transversale]|nr:hypothetical protein BX616_004250 [Lobosporangium transversale]